MKTSEWCKAREKESASDGKGGKIVDIHGKTSLMVLGAGNRATDAKGGKFNEYKVMSPLEHVRNTSLNH